MRPGRGGARRCPAVVDVQDIGLSRPAPVTATERQNRAGEPHAFRRDLRSVVSERSRNADPVRRARREERCERPCALSSSFEGYPRSHRDRLRRRRPVRGRRAHRRRQVERHRRHDPSPSTARGAASTERHAVGAGLPSTQRGPSSARLQVSRDGYTRCECCAARGGARPRRLGERAGGSGDAKELHADVVKLQGWASSSALTTTGRAAPGPVRRVPARQGGRPAGSARPTAGPRPVRRHVSGGPPAEVRASRGALARRASIAARRVGTSRGRRNAWRGASAALSGGVSSQLEMCGRGHRGARRRGPTGDSTTTRPVADVRVPERAQGDRRRPGRWPARAEGERCSPTPGAARGAAASAVPRDGSSEADQPERHGAVRGPKPTPPRRGSRAGQAYAAAGWCRAEAALEPQSTGYEQELVRAGHDCATVHRRNARCASRWSRRCPTANRYRRQGKAVGRPSSPQAQSRPRRKRSASKEVVPR